MTQTLTYYTLSKTATFNDSLNSEQLFFNVDLQISASAYDADSSGSGFGVTVGDIRVYLISGSEIISSFPYDQINILYNSSSAYVTSSDNSSIQFTTLLDNSLIDNSYYFKVINSSSLEEKINTSLFPFQNFGYVTINSSSKYNIQLYSGNNKRNILYLYNSASILVLSSSWIGTSSYGITLNPTSSNLYYVSTSIENLCCALQLDSIISSGSNLIVYYTTGSCGTYSGSFFIQSSNDQISWITYGSSSIGYPYTASVPYPVDSYFYRLIAVCSGGYYSDPSNTLYYEY